MRRLLLDTNVAVWLLLGDRAAVSSTARNLLEDIDSALALSAVSVWEIAIKRSLGKIDLADGWARELRSLDLDPLSVTVEHAAAVERLPWHHRDPFDRLLVAQAATEQCALVSADERLQAYAVEVIW